MDDKELKFQSNINKSKEMLENHKEQLKVQEAESYIKAQVNNKKKEKIRKNNIKKRVVKTVLIASCGAAIAMAGNFAHTQNKGANNLGKEMNEIIKEDNYSFCEYSDGYKVNQGNNFVDTDEALTDIVDAARDKGMSYAEIVVGMNDCIGNIYLDNIIGEDNVPSLSEKISVKEKAYHESKIKTDSMEVTK